jgi:hypothetical protein
MWAKVFLFIPDFIIGIALNVLSPFKQCLEITNLNKNGQCVGGGTNFAELVQNLHLVRNYRSGPSYVRYVAVTLKLLLQGNNLPILL